ncbi:hypothetical protein HPB47_024682 [Ixodes persulcatus]|uniref:Uncharacterized protein n=1 Tax=Ixodes persulcatus TaxID=34615 RepID=A0AC60Q5X7_IXOPE|nr:hypothetical protein HPB47_024682 [Ixodes persulcatus]
MTTSIHHLYYGNGLTATRIIRQTLRLCAKREPSSETGLYGLPVSPMQTGLLRSGRTFVRRLAINTEMLPAVRQRLYENDPDDGLSCEYGCAATMPHLVWDCPAFGTLLANRLKTFCGEDFPPSFVDCVLPTTADKERAPLAPLAAAGEARLSRSLPRPVPSGNREAVAQPPPTKKPEVAECPPPQRCGTGAPPYQRDRLSNDTPALITRSSPRRKERAPHPKPLKEPSTSKEQLPPPPLQSPPSHLKRTGWISEHVEKCSSASSMQSTELTLQNL